MRLNKCITAVLSLGIAAACLGGVAKVLSRQASGQELPRKQRTIPIYATNKDGTPVTRLTPADLEVLVSGKPVGDYGLTKGGSQNKLVFLVFDTASISSNLLSKSKKIAEKAVSQAPDQVRFVVMTIDPGAGLRPVCGPSTDKEFILRTMAKSVVSKESGYFRSRATSDTGIRDTYPEWRNNTPATTSKRNHQEDRQVGTIIVTSLWTLNSILARFPQSDKVVHLYSCGIPLGATVNRSKFTLDRNPNTGVEHNVELSSPDAVIYDQIKGAGQSIKKSSALLFLINPGGTRGGQDDATSGEGSLHMLANESGGRYFEGADKDIIQALATTEEGYYELSFPPLLEIQEPQVAIEIRPKNHELTLSTVTHLHRARRFAAMTPEEKQGVVLSVLTDGLVGDLDLKISTIPVNVQPAGYEVQLTAQLPLDLSQSEWDIYKVWRERGKGVVAVEKEHVLSDGPLLTFGMAPRDNTVQDAVLVHSRSGTVLVCQSKDGPRS